jgi:RNA polymerase sigma-70 factor (ECF subfamily)
VLKLTNDLERARADQDVIDVEFAVSGDTLAFERLYRRHVGRVNALARWLMGDDDVEDVLQEVFIRVWQKLDTFKGQAAFSTWLHRLATNVILRRRKTQRGRERRHAGSELDLEQAAAAAASPGLAVDLETAVARLPERARQVFALHDMAGYKHSEIGAMLGISTGTSRSQLHHARMALRTYFEA